MDKIVLFLDILGPNTLNCTKGGLKECNRRTESVAGALLRVDNYSLCVPILHVLSN